MIKALYETAETALIGIFMYLCVVSLVVVIYEVLYHPIEFTRGDCLVTTNGYGEPKEVKFWKYEQGLVVYYTEPSKYVKVLTRTKKAVAKCDGEGS